VADGSAFRNDVLRRYDFTPAARAVLQQIPVEVEDLSQPRGGGYWYSGERRVYLFGAQDEACIHELAHAWADETGFYVDPRPDDPRRPGRHFEFRRDVERAAGETDPAYQRVAFLAWEYTYGNPTTGFKGMGELDWERFAGLASGVMGDIRLMPYYLRRWYEPLFGGSPAQPEPNRLPPWAPPGWRQGAAPPRPPPDPLLQKLVRWLRHSIGRR
jgi:hypothetical protein